MTISVDLDSLWRQVQSGLGSVSWWGYVLPYLAVAYGLAWRKLPAIYRLVEAGSPDSGDIFVAMFMFFTAPVWFAVLAALAPLALASRPLVNRARSGSVRACRQEFATAVQPPLTGGRRLDSNEG